MTELPKIIVDRMRAATARTENALVHPDANQLTAFAEQSLPVEERESVLRHLALCEDCRGVVTLALPASEAVDVATTAEAEPAEVTAIATKTGRNWLSMFGWPTLRWAALAAGVIAGSALLMTRHGAAPTPIAQNRPVAAPASASPVRAGSAIQTPATAPQPSSAASATQNRSTAATVNERVQPAPAEPQAGLRPDYAAKAKSGILIGQAPRESLSSNMPVPASPGPRASGAVAELQSAPAASNDQMARNEAPAVLKAKPAPPEAMDQKTAAAQSTANAYMAGAAVAGLPATRSMAMSKVSTLKKDSLAKQEAAPFSLRIEAGLLQRSVDGGVTWQVGLHADHPLTCFAQRASEVWAGGEAATLYRSTDGGVTWTLVRPSVNAQSLTADVVSIKFAVGTVVVSTRDNATWTTATDGQAWERSSRPDANRSF